MRDAFGSCAGGFGLAGFTGFGLDDAGMTTCVFVYFDAAVCCAKELFGRIAKTVAAISNAEKRNDKVGFTAHLPEHRLLGNDSRARAGRRSRANYRMIAAFAA
jgi:hypothetical protein